MAKEPATYVDIFKHLNEGAIDTANLFLRSSILINGGAAVAVLGFVASVAKAGIDQSDLIIGIADAIALFAYGAAAGVVGILLAYLTNYAAGTAFRREGERSERFFVATKRILHLVALATALSTIGFFVWGIISVKTAIICGLT